jgi:hypothetical protein
VSFPAKRRVVFTLLALLTVWPLCHRILVARYEISPWRLFGWAMYCTPILAVEVGVVPENDGQPIEVDIPQELRRELSLFTKRRQALGRLARIEPLAEALLGGLKTDSLVLTIQHNWMDPRSARIRGRREYHRYRYDAAGRLIGERLAVRDLP